MCNTASWVNGQWYGVGSIVKYSGLLYSAKNANPGYNPSTSTYHWARYTSWSQSQQYIAGGVVAYEGKLYIAKHANPGYNPTISTYYWAPYGC